MPTAQRQSVYDYSAASQKINQLEHLGFVWEP